MSNYSTLILEHVNSALLVRINRPEQLNALNAQVIEDLARVLDNSEKDASVRVLILTGSGEKSFVAGADIKEFAHYSPEQGQELSRKGHELLFNRLENYSKPVIAAINGFALGGGLELALACHIRLAAEGARMGLPEVSLGLIPGYGGTQRLPALIGSGVALEMILSAQMIPAERALNIGLVNHVYPNDQLIPKALEFAAVLAKQSPHAQTMAIASVVSGVHRDRGFEEEIKAFGRCFGTADSKEGIAAFLDKRKPEF